MIKIIYKVAGNVILMQSTGAQNGAPVARVLMCSLLIMRALHDQNHL